MFWKHSLLLSLVHWLACMLLIDRQQILSCLFWKSRASRVFPWLKPANRTRVAKHVYQCVTILILKIFNCILVGITLINTYVFLRLFSIHASVSAITAKPRVKKLNRELRSGMLEIATYRILPDMSNYLLCRMHNKWLSILTGICRILRIWEDSWIKI